MNQLFLVELTVSHYLRSLHAKKANFQFGGAFDV